MNDEQLLRYSRQIMLPQIDIAGQQRLLQSHALIIGLGGLGSPVAMYLATAGVGQLTLADFDTVELSNLQRQIAHTEADIGRAKVDSAADTVRALNPEVTVSTLKTRLEGDTLREAVRAADVVIDASDNFPTRFAINRACVAEQTPLVSGAAIRLEGQVSVFPFSDEQQPCYHCLYTDDAEDTTTCSDTGVLAPVVGIIGCIQATETLKLLADMGTPLAGRLLILDANTMEFREMRLRRDPQCPTCGSPALTQAASS
jgi:adenylyltransferase/sulfurtransferase